MEIDDEWMYSELLDLLKKQKKEKEESYYRPIELEIPLMEPPAPIGDEKTDQEKKDTDRGVIIIEF